MDVGINDIEAILNHIVAFSSGISLLDFAVELQNATHFLESTGKVLVLTETCMSLCIDLLENSPPHGAVVYSVLQFLARCCMHGENRELACRFDVFGLSVLILWEHQKLPDETLFVLFDLLSTLSMADGNTRRMLRPSIPYVAAVMKERPESLQLAFGGAVVIATLTMLDTANAILAIEQDCIQLLVSSFIRAHDKKKQLTHQRDLNSFLRNKRAEEEQLCESVMRWSRDALQKLIHAPLPIIEEKLKAADFGKFGFRVEVDELKWFLKLGRQSVKGKQL